MLSRTQFETIASEIAATISQVSDYSISGYRIDLTVHSRSRKSRYNVEIEYDPEADHFHVFDPYEGGGVKIIFLREFRQRQRSL